MKKIRKVNKFKTIGNESVLIVSSIILFMITVFGLGSMLTARADVGRPQFNKSYHNNGDGTYTLSLDITGKSQMDVDADKVNVVIVIDTSGSMSFPANTTGGATKATGDDVGRYMKSGDSYYRLYYKASDGKYYPEGKNTDGTDSRTRHSTVYYPHSINSSNGTIRWEELPNDRDRYNFTNNNTRLEETQTAVKSLIATLLNQNNNAANVDDVVEISLITFSTYSTYQAPTTQTGSWTKGTSATNLNNIVDSKLQSVNINSSTYSNEVKQKLAAAIDSNAIYNRQQIDSLILQSSKIYKNK